MNTGDVYIHDTKYKLNVCPVYNVCTSPHLGMAFQLEGQQVSWFVLSWSIAPSQSNKLPWFATPLPPYQLNHWSKPGHQYSKDYTRAAPGLSSFGSLPTLLFCVQHLQPTACMSLDWHGNECMCQRRSWRKLEPEYLPALHHSWGKTPLTPCHKHTHTHTHVCVRIHTHMDTHTHAHTHNSTQTRTVSYQWLPCREFMSRWLL